ncbi:MAG: hypothetical protein AAFY15_12090 [Cyanobacteria bacterium J06648_11]
MYTVLLTYGLNPKTGLKVMLQSPQKVRWQQLWRHLRKSDISVGTLVPSHAARLSRLELLARLKFFVAIEGDSEPQKALPAARDTAVKMQIYEHQEGKSAYRAEVVRFKLGKKHRTA